MKILFVWDSDYPWDIRVSKICHSFLNKGHEVHLVCRNQHRRPSEELYEGIHIHRIFSLPRFLGRLNNIFGFPLFVSPVWLVRIFNSAKHNQADVIIVRDLPMAPAALFIGKLMGLPVILDMAECYPELIRLIWKFEPFRIANIVVRNPWLADLVEKAVINNIDHVWVMIEESRDRLLQKGIPDDKISIVSNTPDFQRFATPSSSTPETIQKHSQKLILLYAGFVNFSRGLDVVVDSIPRILQDGVDVFCVIIGTGTAENDLQDKVRQLGIQDNLSFEGWVDNKQIPDYIFHSDICLVPHHRCSHWDNTIPNKLFDYMAAAKPVLVSNVRPMQRIVEEVNCGLIFQSGSAASFASRVVKLSDVELRHKLGTNGLHAVQSKFNWNNEERILFDSLKKLVHQ
ncbi:MAG: glycosyltransferase family 4 protein [Desulfobulbaceae bacterium]|nr:glycosyltransferase family 4 protein [Desulfobulbaceae bacterium]